MPRYGAEDFLKHVSRVLRPQVLPPAPVVDQRAIQIDQALPGYVVRLLAQTGPEISVDVRGPVTQRSVLDAVERRYPMLRGTMRDHDTQRRRPLVRFFACEDDLSNESPDSPLPAEVASGDEPLLIVGAIAGG